VTAFWLCFVPLFVAVDPIGQVPVFLSLTRDVERPQMGRLILQSVLTATFSKIAGLLLASIAVMLIRRGVVQIVTGAP
jgi:multiple antibiotic resistance protein